MSDTSAFGFGPFAPGFDFLQNLARSASATQTPGSAIPGMSSWVAPTLSVEELDKRIQELKAVQFWLEQNGTALKATIQALEVQKMTLSTLQGMNVNMAELARAFTAKVPAPAPATGFGSAPAPAPTPAPAPEPEPEPEPEKEPAQQAQAAAGADTGARARTQRKADRQAAAQGKAGATVDPMQWWGSLTQQFQNIAAAALQDAAAQARKAQTTAGEASARAGGKAGTKAPVAQPSSRSSSARQTARKTSAKTSGKTSGTRKAAARPASPTARSPRS